MMLFDLCKDAGIISQSGAWFSFGEMRLGQGRANCITSLRMMPDLCWVLYDRLLTQALAKQGVYPDGAPIPGFQRETHASLPFAERFQPIDEAQAHTILTDADLLEADDNYDNPEEGDA